MAITLPTFSPAEPHSIIDFGRYVADSSTPTAQQLLSVDSTLKPGGVSSIVVKAEMLDDNVPGVPDTKLSVYTVVRGNLDSYTDSQIIALKDRVSATLSAANLLRMRRGER